MATLIQEPNDIPLDNLLQGQLAVITAWGHNAVIGQIVQRHNDDLIVIGQNNAWPDIFDGSQKALNEYRRVKCLPNGATIKV